MWSSFCMDRSTADKKDLFKAFILATASLCPEVKLSLFSPLLLSTLILLSVGGAIGVEEKVGKESPLNTFSPD